MEAALVYPGETSHPTCGLFLRESCHQWMGVRVTRIDMWCEARIPIDRAVRRLPAVQLKSDPRHFTHITTLEPDLTYIHTYIPYIVIIHTHITTLEPDHDAPPPCRRNHAAAHCPLYVLDITRSRVPTP